MNNCSLKRINKELNDFNDKNYYQIPNFSVSINNFFDQLNVFLLMTDDRSSSSLIRICNKKNNKIILELLIPDCYPFKPYQIMKHNLNDRNKLLLIYHQSVNIIQSRFFDNKFKHLLISEIILAPILVIQHWSVPRKKFFWRTHV